MEHTIPQTRTSRAIALSALATLRRILGRVFSYAAAVAGIGAIALSSVAIAETMESALAKAYVGNPQLNAQRAQLRKTDEAVPQALAGYRPTVNANIEVGKQYSDTEVTVPAVTSSPAPAMPAPSGSAKVRGSTTPRSVGLSASKTLYDGFQTANRVRSAEAQVVAGRETLRMMEQTVLLSAATVYTDYLRDQANVSVQRSNVQVLQQTVKDIRARLNVGTVTDTDVAQAEAQLAAGEATLYSVESTLRATRATYRRIIGVEPENLAPAAPVDRLVPGSLERAINLASSQNPLVTGAMAGVDVALVESKAAESALSPRLTLQGNVAQQYEPNLLTQRLLVGTALLNLTIPIYQGGREYSLIRAGKEEIAQQRLTLDQVRDQVRADVTQSWWRVGATKSLVEAAQRQVKAAEAAFNGVQAEARLGRRTTLDVLISQQALVNARVSIVSAQRDRVVASYSLLSAVGQLSPTNLGLKVQPYDPTVHYHQVRDAWGGVRTPDGR
jgi:outer membrane protein